MRRKHYISSDLQPPGAGLPGMERVALNGLFRVASSLLSDKFALRKFRKESQELKRLAVADEDESYDVFQQITIPRVIGIEDSSRNWSVMMTLAHLCLTTADMLTIVKALVGGVVPHGELEIADYKPSPDVGYEVLDQFEKLEREYCGTIEELLASQGSLATPARYTHPWFGPLSAHQWHYLAGVHHQIHRRQMQKIIAMLGVT